MSILAWLAAFSALFTGTTIGVITGNMMTAYVIEQYMKRNTKTKEA